jgi:SAM-dependent methyltransferase
LKIAYNKQNKRTYDSLAKEYEKRIPVKEISAIETVDFLSRYISKFHIRNVLECGPGNGSLARELIQRKMKVTAIEISKGMGEIATKNANNLKIIIEDFMEYDFKNRKFDLVVGKNFIHLFKFEDAKKVLNKMRSLLNRQGLIYLTTTIHNTYHEGFEKKLNYPDAPARYRVRYTGTKFKNLILSSDLKILEYSELYRDINTVPDVLGTMRVVLVDAPLSPLQKTS